MARLISEDLGIKLENVKLEDLGRAKKLIVDKDNTTIVEGAGKQATSRAASQPSAARSKRRLRTTIARNSRSVLRSLLAVSP